MSKINSAATVLHTHMNSPCGSNDAWLNVGIAGHHSHPTGDIFLAHSIRDEATGKRWYPQFIFNSPAEQDR